MINTIPGLRQTSTYQVATAVYHRHHDPGTGVCATCNRPAPCQAARDAGWVLHAAGDTLDTDRPAQPGEHQVAAPAAGVEPQQPADPPEIGGFAIQGRRRSLPAAGFGYEREDQ